MAIAGISKHAEDFRRENPPTMRELEKLNQIVEMRTSPL